MSPLCAIAFAAALLAQDAAPDRVTTSSGEEVRGAVERIEPDGALVVATDKGPRTIPLDDVRRIRFEDQPKIAVQASATRLRPRCGGFMSGELVSIDAARVTFKAPHGTYTFLRNEVRSIGFGEIPAIEKELGEDRDLVILAGEDAKAKEGVVVSGDVESITAERVKINGIEHPRSRLREIRFRAAAPREPAVGLFARVQLKNGDGLVGLLRAVEPGRVKLFTHYAGGVDLEKSSIHSISMVPQARLQSGHILVATPVGVTEVDRQGAKLWSYNDGVAGCTSARKLPGGNVLITLPNQNKVIEVRPSGAEGGHVLWTQGGLTYPYDALRLDNGNTLVAEYGSSRLAEFDPKEFAMKWSASIQGGPMNVELLEGGGFLVSINQGLPYEVDSKGKVVRRLGIAGLADCRATVTVEGTILVADARGIQVLEVDRKGTVLWRMEAAQPRHAIRLDDGSTIILRRNGELMEVDTKGEQRRIGTFPNATFISVY